MPAVSNYLYTPKLVQELDRIAIQEQHIPGYSLMTQAGGAAFNLIKSYWHHIKSVAVFCGQGNNGGDGFVVARLLQQNGYNVQCYLIGKSSQKVSADAARAKKEFEDTGLLIQSLENFDSSAELIVDAMLGTGIRPPLEPEFASAIAQINRSKRPVLAIDIPSGIDGATGEILDCAVKAQVTLTFIGLKIGLFCQQAVDHVGELVFDDLGVPIEVYNQVMPVAQKVAYPHTLKHLPALSLAAHKGSKGHVLIIGGGESHFSGAACLAGEAALRSGAGLVSACVAPQSLSLMARAPQELMCYSYEDPKELDTLFEKINTLLIGPGLGQNKWSTEFFNTAIEASQTVVIDADGLNLLAKSPRKRTDWVLTPHPGEAARLLGKTVKECESDRIKTILSIQKKYGGIVVLKGVSTLIIDLDEKIYLIEGSVPSLATGGTGDVLAGLIAGLIGQGIEPLHAATIAVSVHREAGLLEYGFGERGMLASELFLHIRSLLTIERSTSDE